MNISGYFANLDKTIVAFFSSLCQGRKSLSGIFSLLVSKAQVQIPITNYNKCNIVAKLTQDSPIKKSIGCKLVVHRGRMLLYQQWHHWLVGRGPAPPHKSCAGVWLASLWPRPPFSPPAHQGLYFFFALNMVPH